MSKNNYLSRTVAYGVSIRNSKAENALRENTIALKELSSIGFVNKDIYIDIVNFNTSKRPELDKLIEELNPGDTIQLYSIYDLIKGQGGINEDNSVECVNYYKRIIEKGIKLVIFDPTSPLARLSKFSSDIGSNKYFYDFDKLYADLENEYKTQSIVRRHIAQNVVIAQTNPDFLKESLWFELFETIYFYYEAYQITSNTALDLLKEYCNVKTKLTFWNVASAFEKHIFYASSLENFNVRHISSDILNKPKRCNLPTDAYNEIKKRVKEIQTSIPELTEEETVLRTFDELRYVTSYEVYKRIDLAFTNENQFVKPRLDLVDVNLIREELQNIIDEYK